PLPGRHSREPGASRLGPGSGRARPRLGPAGRPPGAPCPHRAGGGAGATGGSRAAAPLSSCRIGSPKDRSRSPMYAFVRRPKPTAEVNPADPLRASRAVSGQTGTESLLSAQRSLGNQAVLRWLQTQSPTGRIARQPDPPAPPPPAAAPTLKELNGWPMENILARLNDLAEAPLLALINEAKTVQGLNAPRLQLALDVVYTKKFSRAVLPEFEAILPGRMESIIPVLENADQQEAIKK